MDGRPTWTDCDEAGDYVVPNVLSQRDLVYRPDKINETVPHSSSCISSYDPCQLDVIKCSRNIAFLKKKPMDTS